MATVAFLQTYWPGLRVPGPPKHPCVRIEPWGGGLGFTDAEIDEFWNF